MSIRNSIERAVTDVAVLAIIAAGKVLVHMREEHSVDFSRLIGSYALPIWISAMALMSCARALAELAILRNQISLFYQLIEWIAVAVLANLIVVVLDVSWYPEYSFKTVLTFASSTMIIPAVVASAATYLAVSAVVTRWNKKSATTR